MRGVVELLFLRYERYKEGLVSDASPERQGRAMELRDLMKRLE